MGGIACILHPNPDRVSQALAGVEARLVHRGPDATGSVRSSTGSGTLALVQTRLAINDRSAGGHLPMTNPGTGDLLIFDGEIYNHAVLRRELAGQGVTFRGGSDCETLLMAYAAWGSACISRLRGMFAFVLYDAARQQLVIARDHSGIKPLYYTLADGGLMIASEVQAFAAASWTSHHIDARAVAGLMAYGMVPEPLTMMSGIGVFPAATLCELPLERPLAVAAQMPYQRYWSPPAPREYHHDLLIPQLRRTIESAVTSQLVADVPLGIFLSGGMDSTIIAGIAAKERHGQVDALTVSMPDDPELDEAAAAQATARRLGIRHQLITIPPQQLPSAFDRWLTCMDQPGIDGFNAFLVSRAARERGFTIAVSGLGGDELFAGYPSFRQLPRLLHWLKRGRLVPKWLRRCAATISLCRSAAPHREKLRALVTTEAILSELYLCRRRQCTDRELTQLGLRQQPLHLPENWLPDPHWHGELPNDPIATISLLESRFYLSNMLLRDADVYAMAHALELRTPFLDPEVLALAHSIAGHIRMQGSARENKPLLAEAFHEYLIPEMTAPSKRCLELPYARWITGPLRERFESLIATVAEHGLLERAGVYKLWNAFLHDRSGSLWARAWMLGVFGGWLEHGRRALAWSADARQLASTGL